MNEQVTHDPQKELAPIEIPNQVQETGAVVHHPEHAAVEHAQQLQAQGINAQPAGPAALLTSSETMPSPQELKQIMGLRFRIFGTNESRAGKKLFEEKLKKRELKHAI